MEDFKEIVGFEDYLASKTGIIKKKCNDRILPQYLENKKKRSDNNYYRVNLRINNKQSTKRVHRLVALAHLENPNNYKLVDHIDQNKLNNHSDNLRWTTTSVNNINSKTRKSKYGRYITKSDAENRWYIRIYRSDINNKRKCIFCHSCSADKFTLEDMVKIRDNFIQN